MTEDEARQSIEARYGVSRGTRLARFAEMLRDAAATHNLVAPSTLDQIWSRHIMDSAQLLDLATDDRAWLDVGSGAGLPGLVIACLQDAPVELVEPRRLRTEFLASVVYDLSLSNVDIVTAKVERTTGIVGVIAARAVGSLDQLFTMGRHRADLSTVWVLPKGRNAHSEVEAARVYWQGSFHVERSVTAEDSFIVVAHGVRPK
ncbi:MAG: 16S rRNA (guanine(527)-N(7))-methyltransferase RsmG [Sphingobium limneticum]